MKQINIYKVKIGDVKTNPNNPRIIKDDKFKKLVKSIKEFPQMLELRPIVVNTEMIVLGGNMRLKACKEAGLKEVPIIMADELTEEQQKEFIVKDNVGFGEWDWDVLANEWDAVQLEEWGLDGFPFEEVTELEAEEDNYTEPDNIQVDVVLGDLIEIGEHRLLCGDSTDSDQVAKLMNGEKIDIVFTSPPYNAGNSKTGAYGGGSAGRTDFKEMYNTDFDNMSKEDYFKFLMSVLTTISIFCKDDCPILWNVMYNAKSRDDYGKIVFSELNPFSVKETIIWDKGVGMNICSTGILSRSCELIFLMSKGEKYYTNQKQDTYWNVWRISNKGGENMKLGHGASFPIKLPFEGIEKFSKENFNVYEPFTGSGTTMVAAHQLKRKCYGMELDPKYCQVIIDRMSKLDPSLEVKINGSPYLKKD
jgi:DNA modification methylase